MNKKRLLKLADLLEADAANKHGVKFDLSLWGTVDNETQIQSCNTMACAMGFAALNGAFKRAGLTFDLRPDTIYDDRTMAPRKTRSLEFLWKGNRIDGFDVAMELFGIDRQTSFWLFAQGHYEGKTTGAVGERKVANRIRKFVAGKVSPPAPPY